MDTVRAKFRVHSAQPAVGAEGGSVSLWAVYDEANKTWAKATPSGSLSMFVTNPEVFAFFEPGTEVFIDIRKV